MNKVYIFIFLILFSTEINAQQSNGVSEYNKGYKSISVRQTAESSYEKERKKLSKYFGKKEYEKADDFVLKAANKSGKDVYILLGDNYFLKGKEKMGVNDFLGAISFYNKSLLYYAKGDYEKESQFVKRDIGTCYIKLYENSLTNDSLAEKAYINLKESHSFDLIERYDQYFARIYLIQYTSTLNNGFLDKAYFSCYNNDRINKFKYACSAIAETLFQKYNADNSRDWLEKSISLYKKLNNQEKLNITYEALANYYIENSAIPERAYDYLNMITSMNSEKLGRYTEMINNKLLSFCKTVDDCIELAERKPELREDIYDKAILIAVSIEDFDKLYRHYPLKKSDIKTKALLSIETISDCQEAYNYFPSKKNEIGIIALKIANSYKELGSVAELFNNVAMDAETKALYNIKTIDDKMEFVTYFSSSTYAPNIQKEIDIEQSLVFKLQVAKEKINSLIINTYSDGKQSNQTFSELDFSEEKEKVITLTYSFDWVVYFSTRPIDYKISFIAYINLDNGNISLYHISLLMDDDPQELIEFMTIQPQIESVFRSLIQDFKTLNMLKSKREVASGLPDYYKFKLNSVSILNNKKKDDSQEHTVLEIVENMPEFPGGESALEKYLATNIKYPQAARESGVIGKVFVNFVVEKDGSITDVKVLRGIGRGCDEEAVRVVKGMPKWKPGTQKGKPVRVSFNLPVEFTLQN